MDKIRLVEQIDDRGHLSIDITLEDDGSIIVFFYDVGTAAQETFGRDDYEKWMKIPADVTGRLAFKLLSERFAGSIHALSEIEKYCQESGISPEVGGW